MRERSKSATGREMCGRRGLVLDISISCLSHLRKCIPHWALFVTEFRCECISLSAIYLLRRHEFLMQSPKVNPTQFLDKFSELILSNCCDFCYRRCTKSGYMLLRQKIVLLTFLLVPKNQALILNIRILNK
jgi:hypothetical protein